MPPEAGCQSDGNKDSIVKLTTMPRCHRPKVFFFAVASLPPTKFFTLLTISFRKKDCLVRYTAEEGPEALPGVRASKGSVGGISPVLATSWSAVGRCVVGLRRSGTPKT
jgi:hypothetical protein